jgi:hypothetical protein
MYLYLCDPWINEEQECSLNFMIIEHEKGLISFDNDFFMKKFIENINAENHTKIEIQNNITSWDIIPVRTCYYTDFLGADEWQDNWQSLWMVKINLKSSLKSHLLKEGIIEIGLEDVNQESIQNYKAPKNINSNDPISCMIICQFSKDIPFSLIKSTISTNDFSEMQRKYNVQSFSLQHVEHVTYQQVHINLGLFSSDFFSCGADYANQIIQACKQLGGIHNCKSLFL